MDLTCHHLETVQHKKMSRSAKLWGQILEGHNLTEDIAILVYFYGMNINCMRIKNKSILYNIISCLGGIERQFLGSTTLIVSRQHWYHYKLSQVL